MKYIILLSLFTIGCSDNPKLDRYRYDSNIKIEEYDIGSLKYFRVLTLRDGTRCAMYKDGYGASIHCDWK